MQIKDMFERNIARPITGVIKVGQIEENNKKEELQEYVVTNELVRHFTEFFANYAKSIHGNTDEMGVWISGFFGSGKSHFLKILSYILDNEEVGGKRALEYFREKAKLSDDPTVMANMELACQTPTKAILFNVDSKSTATGKSDSNAIVMVFNRVFNEKLGYCGAIPALADLERELDQEGRFQEFQYEFQEIYGHSWLDSRHKFRLLRGKVELALVKMNYMNEEEAKLWAAESVSGYHIAIEDFAERVRKYVERTGEHIVFLADEIGQYISSDSGLMLNLQTLTEELGSRCKGKAWVIVTAQEDIDSMTDDMKSRGQDFSKIQGRFKTRLSLSSVNADEVIQERILKKNEAGKETLKGLYEIKETTIKNVIEFKDTIELKKYRDAGQFAAIYPFLPYQFNLLGDVLNAIRLNSSTGKHLSEGERSMLGAFQQATVSIMEQEDGVLVPFYRFYDDLVKFLDHTHAGVIQRAQDNERLNPGQEPDCFTINVLKTLFLLKYVKGVPMTMDNLVSLMVTHIEEDRVRLKHRISDALKLLMKEMLVSQVQDTYEFLTDEEQDINRFIQNQNVQIPDVIEAVTDMVYDQIYTVSRFRVPKFNGRYTFPFNQAVDTKPKKTVQNSEIGIRLITPWYTGSSNGKVDDLTLAMMSASKHEVVMLLPATDESFLRDLQNSLKIDKYIRNVPDPQKGKSTAIRSTKIQESGKSKASAMLSLKQAIGAAAIYINGKLVTDITAKDPNTRMNEAMSRLVDDFYYKLSYIESAKDDIDIQDLFKEKTQMTLQLGGEVTPNGNALKEVREYINLSTSSHMPISLKNLIDQFTKAPYGFVEEDVKWIAAKLFRDGVLNVTVDKEPVTMFNRKPEELGNYFTNRRLTEKLLFLIRETVEPRKMKACKEVIRELFKITETTGEAGRLMDSFVKKAGVLLEECEDMLREYKHIPAFPDYPGESALSEIKRLLKDLVSIEDENEFFQTIYEEQDELMELADEIDPIKVFFHGEQKKIFEESGLRPLKLYGTSSEHIVNAEIKEIIDQITRIVRSKAPYAMIKDLPDLYKRFMVIYNEILDQKVEPVKQVIEQDKEAVLEAMNGKSYENKYREQVLRDFMDLEDRVDKINDISEMLGFKDKADSKREMYFNLIDNEAEELQEAGGEQGEQPINGSDQTGTGVPVQLPQPNPNKPKQKKVRNIMARNLATAWRIETEEDLERCLNGLREQVKKQMDSDSVIKIQF